MESTNTRLQWSRSDDGKEIVVVRGDTEDEFLKLVDWAREKFPASRTMTTSTERANAATSYGGDKPKVIVAPGVCSTCGAEAKILSGIGKTGRPYKIAKCQAVEKAHDKFIND